MPTKKYKAFLSYSHADEDFGKWLHKQLERYKIPKKLYSDYPNLPKSLYPIFRDRYELNAGDDLGVEIPKALADSEALIVVCSPNSANSKWVNQEIIDFKKMYGEERIFPIIIGGEPFTKESDKFEDSLECFPEALKYRVDGDGNLTDERTSILASSTIEKEDGRELAKLKLIAGVLEISFGEFYRRDEEQKKRDRNRLVLIWSIVALVMAGFTVFSWIQKNIAKEETLKTQNALYNNTIEQGVMYRNNFNELIKAKHIFAKTIDFSLNKQQEEYSTLLYNSINNIKLKIFFHFDNSIRGLLFSKHGKYLLTWSEDKTVTLWNIENQKKLGNYIHDGFVSEVKFMNDEKEILSISNGKIVKLINLLTGSEELVIGYNKQLRGMHFTKDEKYIFVWDDKLIKVWNKDIKKRNFFNQT
ncbi:TIR domain-containing protein [bacterium]|nr:TIR domain-containing protein [bacterium]MBU1958755.1 TIR domain-containing protein [bacterium]